MSLASTSPARRLCQLAADDDDDGRLWLWLVRRWRGVVDGVSLGALLEHEQQCDGDACANAERDADGEADGVGAEFAADLPGENADDDEYSGCDEAYHRCSPLHVRSPVRTVGRGVYLWTNGPANG